MSDVFGQTTPESGSGETNRFVFLVKQLLARVRTATLVRVVSCTNDGDVEPPGTVVVQPLVNALDGAANAVTPKPINNVPYRRLQGGDNAIIMDPAPGDIGLATFADRDISSVKRTKAQSNPGSGRRFDFADGLFADGYLNGTPVQYVRFFDGGVDIVDRNGNLVQMRNNGVTITDLSGNIIQTRQGFVEITTPQLRCTGQVYAFYGTAQQVSLGGHRHTQPVDSHGDTEAETNPPAAGT